VIVRSIRVANWRCLLDEIEVGPFEDGLNILHAANGLGKSTLFEALRRALLDGHRVTGRDVEALRAMEPEGVAGVIIGRALYDGSLALREILRLEKQ